MRSYVYYGSDEDNETVGDEALRSSSIDSAGVARVLGYERSCGRIPEEQDHSNPGFDVLSRDATGNVLRRIEVKSVGRAWSLQGVLLSRRQYVEATDYRTSSGSTSSRTPKATKRSRSTESRTPRLNLAVRVR
ncbi:protein NO VEIN domain-containing protein [Pengzhenrongella phosphoraccumulans]|uniref:protein NO VEIN domain-containing protein n=1 Tax=Pengzhenrongella phosphoraccumulans TaxID=3114394 RepID=UPI00388E0986